MSEFDFIDFVEEDKLIVEKDGKKYKSLANLNLVEIAGWKGRGNVILYYNNGSNFVEVQVVRIPPNLFTGVSIIYDGVIQWVGTQDVYIEIYK